MKKFIVKKRTQRKPIFKNIPMGSSLQISEKETSGTQKIGDFIFFNNIEQELKKETAEKLMKEVDDTFFDNLPEDSLK